MKPRPRTYAPTIRAEIALYKRQIRDNPNAFQGCIAGWKAGITRMSNELVAMGELKLFHYCTNNGFLSDGNSGPLSLYKSTVRSAYGTLRGVKFIFATSLADAREKITSGDFA